MPGWWRSRGGRTRRPRAALPLPGEVGRQPGGERRLVGFVAARLPYLALLGGLVWLTAYLLTAPEFAARPLRVVGQRLVPAERLHATSDVAGQSVFLLSSAQVERAALALRPVESARLTIAWPNRPTLAVVERQPFAVWQAAGVAHLVSRDGVVLAPLLAPGGDEALPVRVRDLAGRPLAVGDEVDQDALAQAAYLAGALRRRGLGGGWLELSPELGLVAPAPGGARVAFGRGDLAAKVEALGAIQAALREQGISPELVDLRIADRPYYR